MGDFDRVIAGQAFLDQQAKPVSFSSIAPPTLEELRAMSLTPRCLLPELLYADVRCRIAAGGVGKTTLVLFEAANLALGWELWGRTPGSVANTLIVSREDNRQTILARLREVMNGMELDERQQRTVLDRVRILDMSADPFRLSVVVDNVVLPSIRQIDELLDFVTSEGFMPDWVILDPAVSFGVGESRVNDAEQGLIEAARIIRNRLNCCVEYIHHSGKANAREKNTDQYAGRGGSAFADGARMVVVMQPMTPDEWLKETGEAIEDGWQGLVMALPKLSYDQPQPPIFIRRKGWRFEQSTPKRTDPDREREAFANQIWQFIYYETSQGRRYSQRDLVLQKDELRLSKHQIEAAVSKLKVSGRLIQVGKNGDKQFLEAIKLDSLPVPEGCGAGGGNGGDLLDEE